MHVKYIQLTTQRNALENMLGLFIRTTEIISKKAVKKQSINNEKKILFCTAGIFFRLKNNKIIIKSINKAAIS